MKRIAELAGEEQTGARGLMTVCERIFRNIKFELPSTKVKRFVVTRELADNPGVELEKLLAEQVDEERLSGAPVGAREFGQRFQENARAEAEIHRSRCGPAGDAGIGAEPANPGRVLGAVQGLSIRIKTGGPKHGA